jgi:Leucine-rich repeat (LRR) protein
MTSSSISTPSNQLFQQGLRDWIQKAKPEEQLLRQGVSFTILKKAKELQDFELCLTETKITSLPDVICNLPHLKTLYVPTQLSIKSSRLIGRITSLEKIYLHRTNYPFNSYFLSYTLPKLTQLKILFLFQLKLQLFPEAITQLTQLTELDISNNQIPELPTEINRLSQLTYLDVSDNRLSHLPETLGELSQLKFLYAKHNSLKDLPETLGNLSNLKFLHIQDNFSLTALPESTYQLTCLEELVITSNELESISNEIQNLTQLKAFEVGANKLQFIPDLSKLHQLSSLYVSDNWFSLSSTGPLSVSHLLSYIGNFKQLTKLGLAQCDIHVIPEEIGHLAQLEKLNLSENELTEIPRAMGRLKKLQRLYLSENPLKSLKNVISIIRKLVALIELDLEDCHFSDLPKNLFKLEEGIAIKLDGCKFSPETLKRLHNTIRKDDYNGPEISFDQDEVELTDTDEMFRIPSLLLPPSPLENYAQNRSFQRIV